MSGNQHLKIDYYTCFSLKGNLSKNKLCNHLLYRSSIKMHKKSVDLALGVVLVAARANRAVARAFNDTKDVFIIFQFRVVCASMMIME